MRAQRMLKPSEYVRPFSMSWAVDTAVVSSRTRLPALPLGWWPICTVSLGKGYSWIFSSSTTAASAAAVPGVMPNWPGSGTAA